MRLFSRLLAPAAVLGLLSVTGLGLASQAAWKKFTPPGGGFSVSFPGVPKTSKQSADQPLGGHIAMTIYSVGARPNFFLVEDALLDKGSPALSAPEALLGGVENGMAGSTNSKVTSSTKTTIQGFPAHRMVLQGQILTKGITLLAGNHCYTIVIASSAGQINQATLDKFVNSFKVQKGNTH